MSFMGVRRTALAAAVAASTILAGGIAQAAGPAATLTPDFAVLSDASPVDVMSPRVAASRDFDTVVAVWKEPVSFPDVAPLRWSLSAIGDGAAKPTLKTTGTISTTTASSELDLAISADGTRAAAAWLQGDWLAWRVYAATALISGEAIEWSAPVTIDSGSRVGWRPRVAVAGDGSRILVTWNEVTYLNSSCSTQHSVFAVLTPTGTSLGSPNRGEITSSSCSGSVPVGEVRPALDADGNTALIATWMPGTPPATLPSATAAMYSLAADGTAQGVNASPALLAADMTVVSAALSDDGRRPLVAMSKDHPSEPNQPVSYHVAMGLRTGSLIAWQSPSQVVKTDNPQRFFSALSASGRIAAAGWAPQVTETGQATTVRAATIGSSGAAAWGSGATASGLTVTSLALSAEGGRVAVSGLKGVRPAAAYANVVGTSVTMGSVQELAECTASSSYGPWVWLSPDGYRALTAMAGTCEGGTYRIAARGAWLRAVPTITTVSPASGGIDERLAMTISGSGFVPGITTVTVAGAAATIRSITSTRIVVTVPDGAAGLADVVVTIDGSSARKADAYRFLNKWVTTVSFARGSSTLSQTASTELRRTAEALVAAGAASTAVVGTGPNRDLANARAKAVAAVLEKAGLTVSRSARVTTRDRGVVDLSTYVRRAPFA